MLFNSLVFLGFFVLFCAGWPFVRQHSTWRWGYITIFSLVFYGWWNWAFVLLLLATAIVDFCAGLGIDRRRDHARLILWTSIATNLLVLGYFKYWFVVSEGINSASQYLGLPVSLPVYQIILPVGISFYTFQSMSYTIDVYRGHCKPTTNLLHFVSAVSFFPHLVAGPIMRASKLLPQLLVGRPATRDERLDGLRLIAHGFFKKMVIADNLAATINDAFSGSVSQYSCAEWWIVVTMFAVQIYCDFSGYSDIARGLVKWFGYEFTVNFVHPYTASSLQDFWNRWHISLSTWFRDYVYVPLGGSRRGQWITCRNIFITMILSAIWHGAGMTFIVWGGIHAACLCLERVTQWPGRLSSIRGARILVWLIVMVQVWMAWVFFRALNVEQGYQILSSMFSFDSSAVRISMTALAFLGLGIAHEIVTCVLDKRVPGAPFTWMELIILIVVVTSCVYLRGPGNQFIYFQF